MNKLRQKSWYYAVVVTALGVSSGIGLFIWAQLFHQVQVLRHFPVDEVGFLAFGSAAVTIIGVFVAELSKKQRIRLTFLFHNPLAWQFIVYILTALVFSSGATLVRSLKDTPFVEAIGIGLNVCYAAFSFYILYKVLSLLFRR